MIPDAIRRKRDELAAAACRVRWCDDRGLEVENREGVNPGGPLNAFGWYVVGTTAGGDAIVVRAGDPGVYFADRTCWRVLFPLARTIGGFLASPAAIDETLDEIE